MSNLPLNDILMNARREAHQMRHYFIGAEHLFIALLDIRGGLASSLVQERGLNPDYVIDAIRRKVGKGSKQQRLWPGIPHTPRADAIVEIAAAHARRHDRNDINEVNERDLLIACFQENDNIPLRVLAALGLDDAHDLKEMARTITANGAGQNIYNIVIEYGVNLSNATQISRDQQLILRRLFHGCSKIRVERYLTGGYSSATVLMVTPIQMDREDAAVAVKIDYVDSIIDEAQRYNSHVRSRLPAMTARLEESPITPETSDLAGLKYTLVTDDNRIPRDLRTVLLTWDGKRLGDWLEKELYPVFGRNWWKQQRPFRFQVWQEYDWMLPPILTLEMIEPPPLNSDGYVIRMPLKRNQLKNLDYGDIVTVEGFIVQKVYPAPGQNKIQLAAGHGTEAARAYKIEMRGVDLDSIAYYRGEIIESITGRVWKTRNEQLSHALRALGPDFDPSMETIPNPNEHPERLPNPIIAYEALLNNHVNGSLSTIHGDLHPGNIMIGPRNSAFLIDFAHTRDGHTIFDWAVLETSLLCEAVIFDFGQEWQQAREILHFINVLNKHSESYTLEAAEIPPTLEVIRTIRKIVSELLADNHWEEYYIALVFCGLRALTWETLSIGARRLMYLVAALALQALNAHPNSDEIDATTPESPPDDSGGPSNLSF